MSNLDEELKDIHRRILAVGEDVTAENLSKALTTGKPLAKAKPQPEPEPEEDEGYDDDDELEDEDEEGDDELDEDEDEEEAPPPPPARTKKSLQGRRKADDEFLKSLLLDERDKRTPMSRVIEATPVLSHISDTFAKSLGLMDERMEHQQSNSAAVELMVKSLVIAVIDLKQEVKRLTKSNNSRVVTQPANGIAYSMNNGLPNSPRKDDKPLNKSLMAEILQAAHANGNIDNETANRALLTLDSGGPEAALAQVHDESLRDIMRDYAEAQAL